MSAAPPSAPVESAVPLPARATAQPPRPNQPEQGAEAADAEQAEARRQQTRAALMRQIAAEVDFPSIQAALRRLRQSTRNEQVHLSVLSNMVLNDVGLTGKLLRIVNAAFYATAGAGQITSLNRAVALVGVDSLELLAAALMVFDRVPPGHEGDAVRTACGTALLSGWLAQQLCPSPKHLDTVYLAALFMNLGDMLVAQHAPSVARRIQRKAEALWLQGASGPSSATGRAPAIAAALPAALHDLKQRAARDVLGITLEDLGCEVARQWGWPEALVQQLRSAYPTPHTPAPVEGSPAHLRALCTAATDWASSLQALPADAPPQVLAAAQSACAQRIEHSFGSVLRLDGARWAELGRQAWAQRDSIVAHLARSPNDAPHRAVATAEGTPFKPKPPPVWNGPDRIAQGLDHALHGLQESDHWAENIDQVIEQLMVDLMEALRLQRVLVALRHPASGDLCGVAGLGLRAPQVVEIFRVPVTAPTDLLGLLCRNGKAALVSDTAEPTVHKRLPAWFNQKVGARTFALLPMVHQGVVQGTIYVDRPLAGTLVLNEREMGLLEAVRDQLLKALVSRGHAA